jgi:hypothetical protein
MAKTKKPNFLFTEENEIPAELLDNATPSPVPADTEAPRSHAAGEPADPGRSEPSVPPPHPPPIPHAPDDSPAPQPDDDEGDLRHRPEDEPPEDDEEAALDAGIPVASPPQPIQTHPGAVHYEARITIVDAWQYPGNLKAAPEWVDRNWAAYADYDPLRDIEPGPALRVPLPSGVAVMVRIGDYVARQEVRLTREISDIRLEVWERQQFEKLFYPVAANQPVTIEHDPTNKDSPDVPQHTPHSEAA